MVFSRYSVMHSKSTNSNPNTNTNTSTTQRNNSLRKSNRNLQQRMSNNDRTFVSPMKPQPEHYSDYGFDPHFDYFQVLEDARNQQREDITRSINSLRLKLHKSPTTDLITPPFNNNNKNTNKKKKKKDRWWRWSIAFNFFRCTAKQHTHMVHNNEEDDRDVHLARARDFRASALPISGPLYMAETPPHYGNQPGMMSPASGCSSPYLSLRELNMERQHLRRMTMSGPASPIYLVT